MKTTYLPRLTVLTGLFIGLALFLTSCSKEKLEEFRENKESTVFQTQEPQIATTSAASFKITPTCCSAGLSIKVNTPMQLTVSYRIISGSAKEQVVASVYYGACDYLHMGCYGLPTSGEKASAFGFYAYPQRSYFIRLQCGDKVGWIPKMDIDMIYAVTIPGTSVTVAIMVY